MYIYIYILYIYIYVCVCMCVCVTVYVCVCIVCTSILAVASGVYCSAMFEGLLGSLAFKLEVSSYKPIIRALGFRELGL